MTTYELAKAENKDHTRRDKALYTLAAVAGAMGSVSDGLNISGADLLPEVAAVALPGIAAWVIARSLFNKNKTQDQA